jgi:hypothetical protein
MEKHMDIMLRWRRMDILRRRGVFPLSVLGRERGQRASGKRWKPTARDEDEIGPLDSILDSDLVLGR